ncbi:hypothetical protein MKX03_002389 [Papaver bracteatum]|nr:hypothetical protein MKX03_002389 [Papaver bracteatum]
MYNRITRDIVLWNPATRKSRLLPKSSNGNPKIGNYHRDFVGLGFDVETKDYKVIQVSSLEPQNENWFGRLNIPRKVEIYCLSTDSWRLLDSHFGIHCCSAALGQSLNGIYYHLGADYTAETDKYVILSFDLSKEKYQRELQIPDDNSPTLQSIGDKLACITAPTWITIPTDGECSGFYIKVWMLNDYHNLEKELWTELYRVDVMSPKIYTRCPNILAILWNGKYGLFVGETVVLYNFIADEIEDLGFGEGMCLCTLTPAIYKESLVSVDAAAKAIST